MKFKIKALFTCLFALVCCTQMASAQMHYERSNRGKNIPIGSYDTTTTTNATPFIIDTLGITNNSAGILEVTVVGQSAVGDGITGKLVYRYKKASGTLTIATPDTASAITADTGLSGGTFALAATSYGNAKLTITGKAATTVRW